MRFMNEWDIASAQTRYADHDILGPATETLANLREWANSNSDGWHIWPKPVRAAARLMEMIERRPDGRTWAASNERADVTLAEYRKALAPIKAFRTRQGANFVIVEVSR